ncbi:MAG: PPC domain-containing protein [Hyphomonadaceae bacterium]
MRSILWVGAASAALMALCLVPAAAQEADQPGDASTQAVLSGDVEGEISPAGDTDWYRLHVEVGQRYNLALAGIANADGQALDPMLAVYDAQGNQVAFNDDANESLNSALRYVPAQSGEVFVEARAFSEEATGRYRLGLSSEPLPADDVGNDASTRARIGAGRTVSGNLEFEGDFDWYRLSARTGNRYRIRLAGSGENGLGDPMLRILDGEGNELAANDDMEGSLNSEVEFVPSANRDVFIEARGYGDGYTGRYDLSVAAERLPRDGVGNSRNTGASIRPGQTHTSTLDFPNDRDWYRIRLVEGQSYRFALGGSGDTPLGDPLLRLYDSRGEEVATDDDGGDGLNAYLEFTAPSSGGYFIEARGFTDDAVGGYTLTARDGEIPGDNTTDATLSIDGDYREAMLGPAGDRDWYRLDLTEGQGVRLGLANAMTPDALQDPMLVLYGPDGAEVARDDDGGDGLNAWLEYQATAAGPHYVEARGYVEEAEGRYAISVTPGEIGATPDGAEALSAIGDPRVATINADGDVDWFVVELVEGRPYRINIESMDPDPLADPMLTLYDAQGNQVASDDDGGRGLNAYLNYASATGGPYFLAVSSFGDTGTGRYQIRATDTDVPGHPYTDEMLDAADDARVSRIEMPGDLDNYRVSLEGGASYTIDVAGVGEHPLADPFLAIVNDENTRLTSDDDGGDGLNARLRFQPEASGDFLLQVSGLGGSTGDYEVKIVRR